MIMDDRSLNASFAILCLRKSLIRRKILVFLYQIRPRSSYTSEIAYNIKSTPTNVLGAIRGMDNRYKKDKSLISLGLIIENEMKGSRFYSLTDLGMKLAKELI